MNRDFRIQETIAVQKVQDTRTPHMIVWHRGEYDVIPARIYVEEAHGCVEGIRYPPNYVYPYDVDAVLEDNMPLW